MRIGFRKPGRGAERGIALLMVLFIVALASVVVVSLSYSTFIQARTIGMIERQLQAEYVLKSLLNLSAALLTQDSDDHVDSYKDLWGLFKDGVEVPKMISTAVGITDPAIHIYLEITPANNGIPLSQINPSLLASGTSQPRNPINWYDPLATLMFNLYEARLNALSAAGKQLPEKPLTKDDFKQLVSNLYDYVDADTEKSQPGQGFPDGEERPNQEGGPANTQNTKITRMQQLAEVPGWTPEIIAMTAPYLSISPTGFINMNTAPGQVLAALPGLEQYAQTIVANRERQDLPTLTNTTDLTRDPYNIPSTSLPPPSMLNANSVHFQVIGKVEYGNQAEYFVKADLDRSEGLNKPPKISNVVLY